MYKYENKIAKTKVEITHLKKIVTKIMIYFP